MQSTIEPQASSEQAQSIADEFEKAAIDAEVRDYCYNAKIIAIKNTSVVVSFGRVKALIHDVVNVKSFEPGEMITIKNNVATLVMREKSKGLTL